MNYSVVAPAGSEPNLILASRVVKTPVYTSDGHLAGHVDDISIDRESGQSVYALIASGGFVRIGAKFHPLPWSMLEYSTFAEGYVLPLTSEDLKDAPHYTRKELADLGGARHHERDIELRDFYAGFGLFH